MFACPYCHCPDSTVLSPTARQCAGCRIQFVVEPEAKPVETESEPVETESKPVEPESEPVKTEAKPVETEATSTPPVPKRRRR